MTPTTRIGIEAATRLVDVALVADLARRSWDQFQGLQGEGARPG
jgi:hypothetical protein